MDEPDLSAQNKMNEEYFSSYDDLEVHQLMLTDTHRVESYRNAIFFNKDIFRDKVVMDVGSGTGILSVMSAQAGAKKVFAVEASDIFKLSEKIIEENKVSHIVKVLNAKVEDVILPENEKVDIIISEWMGFYLLHEGMLDSVLVARDKFLKPNGRIFPEFASLYATPCSIPQLYTFWKNVGGVNMESFGKELRKPKTYQPELTLVKEEDLLAEPALVFEINLRSVTVKDLDTFSSKHVVCSKKDGLYQGLCLWFTCNFPSHTHGDNTLVLSTSPSSYPTHWKQTVIVLPDEYCVEEKEPLAWEIHLSRNEENSRHYNIQLTMLDPEKEIHSIPCDCYMTKCIVARTFLECDEEPTDIIDIT